MPDSAEPTIVVGADRKFMEREGLPIVEGSIDVPCQKCGRDVLLAPSAQRIALGEPDELLQLQTTESGDLKFQPAGANPGPAAVLCMWCAFADHPEILTTLPQRDA